MLWCKCELKTEALIIASMFLICSSISSITYLCMATSPRIIITEESAADKDYGAGTGFAFSFVSCVIDGLLVYGIIKEKRYYLIPWLVLYGLAFLLGELLFLIISSNFLFAFVGLIFVALVGYPWYTIWKYFRYLDPHNPNRPPQTAVYANTGFTNGQFVSDNYKPAPPDTVVYTPGLPAYNEIVAQPQNV